MINYKNLILFSILFLSSTFFIQASDKFDGNFQIRDFSTLIGKPLPNNLNIQAEALIGGEVKLIISVAIIQDNQFVILKTRKNNNSLVTDIFLLPKLSKYEAFLYASCSTRSDMSIINAVGIVDYDPRKEKLKAKKSWLIDYKRKKFIENTDTEIFCVNESFGV